MSNIFPDDKKTQPPMMAETGEMEFQTGKVLFERFLYILGFIF